jgi:AraC-like DNA-binding protein
MSSFPFPDAHSLRSENRSESANLRGPAPQVLIHHPQPFARERLKRQIGGRWPVVEITEWAGIPLALQECAPIAMLIVEPYAEPPGVGLHPYLEQICTSFRSVPIVALVETKPERVRDIFLLGQYGVAEILDPLSGERADVVVGRLQEITERPLRQRLHDEVFDRLPPQAETLLDAAIRSCVRGESVSGLARALFISERTLLRWTSRSGLPAPRELLKWMRVLWAAALLEDLNRRVLDVAWSVGYSTDAGLRRAFRDYLNCSPSELRDAGPWAIASQAFQHRIGIVS